MAENGRRRHIESIAKSFVELAMAHSGEVKAIVTTVIVSSTFSLNFAYAHSPPFQLSFFPPPFPLACVMVGPGYIMNERLICKFFHLLVLPQIAYCMKNCQYPDSSDDWVGCM